MRLYGTVLRVWIVGTLVLGAVFCGGWKWGATFH
jgi:hypothetical protein